MAISLACYALTRPALQLDRKFGFILVVAVLPATLNYVVSKLTGSFLISEKYIAGSYTASAMTFGCIFAPPNARRLSLVSNQWRRILPAALTAVFGVTSALSIPADQEDWRRVIAIANNMYPDSRSEVLLVSSAFFESDHAEFTDDPFVVAPALVYGAKGTLISIPTVAPSAELPWLEELITKHRLDRDIKTIVLLGKKPLSSQPKMIANILGRGLEGLEINNTVIYLLFKINGLVENSSSTNSHDREQP